jgi:hypothetical protein
MTAEAAFFDLTGSSLGEAEDLRRVAAGFDVFLARPMAALAGNALAAVCQGEFGMRILAESRDFIGVTHRASGSADEVGRLSN